MDDKQIDLGPKDYRAEPLPNEPIFGPGWPIGLAVAVSILVTAYFIDGTSSGHLVGGILGVVAYGLVTAFSSANR